MSKYFNYTGSWDMTDWIESELPKKHIHPDTLEKVYRILQSIENGKIHESNSL